MKNQKGITLIALIVYIIVMLIVVSIVTMITTSMTTNLGQAEKASKSASKINKFDMYFLSDIKNEGISIYDIKSNEYIILETQTGNIIQYIFKDNVIFRIQESDNSQIQLCNNITNFIITENVDNENIINIEIQTESYTSNKNYKIGKW